MWLVRLAVCRSHGPVGYCLYCPCTGYFSVHMKKKLKIVEVWWSDAYTKGGWYEYDRKRHRREITLIPAIGIEVDHDKDWLVLAFGYNREANDFVGEFSIPAKMVKRKRVIKTLEV